jgi:Transglutaminase-like superfamily
MRIIHSFLKLNRYEKIIYIKSLFLLGTIRIMLWILPFQIIKIMIKHLIIIPEKNNVHKISRKKLLAAVDFMSNYIPKATCLTRTLAAQILLARYHYKSNTIIGVSKNDGEFEAHAWLESDNQIIFGKSETDYVSILIMGEEIS